MGREICGGSSQVHLKAFHAYESGQLVITTVE